MKELIQMQQADCTCHSVLLNRKILVSGYENNRIFLYSIDTDSYSNIPYCFEYHVPKILINAENRLYLIELELGLIYERWIEDEYNWKQIAKSKNLLS
ncbi:unnamed protein product [Blepharisma stoltei]|uniref:Uncharacterized protein n=1 Tax=Blepharisma stoltei TaxID=1481888 RepID=A0AAU9KEJ4_9CILI|nr:unnamed protein product [Blepharisma stoltei]